MPSAIEKEKRCREIKLIIDDFTEMWHSKWEGDFQVIPKAAEKITDLYFELHENSIREYLLPGAKSNKYKVAAGTEIACMSARPFIFKENDIKERYLNAIFGVYAACNILFAIAYDKIVIELTEAQTSQSSLHTHKVMNTHIKWLSCLNCNGEHLLNTPTLLDSQFWELFGIILESLDIDISPSKE